MTKLTIDYKRYSSTVKTVLMICRQYVNGYHISSNDKEALKEAINELQDIYDNIVVNE